MEPELVNGITEQETPGLNNEDETKGTLEKNTSNVSSSSSSSFCTSHDDKIEEPLSSNTSHNLELEEAFESSRFEPISPFAWSMLSSSPPPTDLNGHSFSHDLPDVYDSNCMAEPVFSAIPSSPAGWSAVSNESLFSIHMGNNSFSQDHAVLFGRLEDWCNQGIAPELNYIAETITGSSGLPTVVEEGSATSGKVSRAESFDSRVSKVSWGQESGVDPDPNTGPLDRNNVNLSNNARFSEESGNSDRSFAFPVLVGEGIKTGSMGAVNDIPEEPHLEEQVQSSTSDNNNKRKKATKKRRFCCWPCTRRG